MTVKIRIPDSWAGRVHSQDARGLLQDFLQSPRALPPDPGAGRCRVSLNIPPRAVKILEGITGDSPSVALRRLLASRRALPSSYRSPIPMLQAAPWARSSPGVALEPRRSVSMVSTPWAGMDSEPVEDMSFDAIVNGGGLLELEPEPVRIAFPGTSSVFDEQSDFSLALDVMVWMFLGGVAAWFLVKLFSPSPAAVAASSEVVQQLPQFKEWIPIGG